MSPRILLVDDDPSVRAALGRVLQDLGHPVTAAGDGEQGLAELQRGSFDLLSWIWICRGSAGSKFCGEFAPPGRSCRS